MPTNRLIVKEQIATYQALIFDAAQSEGGVERVLSTCSQAKDMVKAIRGSAELQGALADPGYTPEQKAQIVRGVFDGVNAELVSAVAIMAERGEVDLLPSVATGIEQRLADELNYLIVDVQTAVELDDKLRDMIKQKVKNELGKDAVLVEHVDKSMLGGIVMSTKDERIDASLLLRVERTREALKQ